MKDRGWLVTTVLLGGVLAAPAALPVAVLHGKGEFTILEWLPGFLAVWLAAVGLFISTSRPTWEGVPAWCRGIAALSLAALAPLAAMSNQHNTQADLALLAMAAAVVLHLRAQSSRWQTAGVLLTAVACGLDATAFILPLGWFWSGLRSKTGHAQAWTLVFAGLGGLVIGRLVGLPMLSGYRIQQSAYAIHRDVAVILVVLALGLAGYAQARFPRRPTHPGWWLPGWAAVSVCVLLAGVLGFAVNVRLAALGLWWLMPNGLAELAALLQGRLTDDRITRTVGLLVALAIVALAVPGLLAWRGGMLMGLYLLPGGG